ncbi:hypothetical protein GCM10018952_00400 [Streptosporangium vulgare]
MWAGELPACGKTRPSCIEFQCGVDTRVAEAGLVITFEGRPVPGLLFYGGCHGVQAIDRHAVEPLLVSLTAG